MCNPQPVDPRYHDAHALRVLEAGVSHWSWQLYLGIKADEARARLGWPGVSNTKWYRDELLAAWMRYVLSDLGPVRDAVWPLLSNSEKAHWSWATPPGHKVHSTCEGCPYYRPEKKSC